MLIGFGYFWEKKIGKKNRENKSGKKRGSFKIKRGSFQKKRGSFKIKRGSFKIKRGSFKIKRGSFYPKCSYVWFGFGYVRPQMILRAITFFIYFSPFLSIYSIYILF